MSAVLEVNDLIDRIEGARADADYWAAEGAVGQSEVTLSLDECTAIGQIMVAGFGAILTGKRDTELAETLALLGGAFKGDSDDDGDEV